MAPNAERVVYEFPPGEYTRARLIRARPPDTELPAGRPYQLVNSVLGPARVVLADLGHQDLADLMLALERELGR